MTDEKTNYVSDRKKWIETTTRKIMDANRLLVALKGHKGKLIDKRFFEEHFTLEGRDGDHTWKYLEIYMTDPSYSFQSYQKRIILARINGDCGEVELQSRETAHAIEETTKMRDLWCGWLAGYEKELKDAEALDEDELIKDLLKIYEKYGQPKIWDKILGSYEVRNPKE